MVRTRIIVEAKVINKQVVHTSGTRTDPQLRSYWNGSAYAASGSFQFRDDFTFDTESRYISPNLVYEVSREDQPVSGDAIRRTIRYSDGATVQAIISGDGDVVRSDRGVELVSPNGYRMVMGLHGHVVPENEAGSVTVDTVNISGIPHGGRYDEPETSLDRLRRIRTLISSGRDGYG